MDRQTDRSSTASNQGHDRSSQLRSTCTACKLLYKPPALGMLSAGKPSPGVVFPYPQERLLGETERVGGGRGQRMNIPDAAKNTGAI